MVDVWVIRGQRLEHRILSAGEAAKEVRDPSSVAWVEVSPAEFTELGGLLDIHPQAIADAVHTTDGSGSIAQRTKLERFPHCELVYLFHAELDADTELDLRPATRPAADARGDRDRPQQRVP